MDFGALPPEVTSGRMYTGPGAESMLTAATVWEGLAAELQAAATSYATVVSGLVDEAWTGPSASAMAGAAAPYVNWMTGAAAQAKQAAVQARAAASAYQTAFAATVPPPVIAANRSLLASLLATNTFGQNTTAIATVEAQYGQMWAQDATAMYGYAAASAAATRLTPFAAAPQTTAAATGGPAAATGPLGMIPQLLQGLAAASTQVTASMGAVLDGGTGLSSVYSNLFGVLGGGMKFVSLGNVAMSGPNLGMVQFKTFFKPVSALPAIPKSDLGAGLGGAGMSSLGAGLGTGGAPSVASGGFIRAVTADVGTAPSVGGLSVPQGWATATPAIRLAATSLPAASLAAAPMAADAGLLNPAALGSLTGGALGTPGSRLINGAGVRGGAAGKGEAPVQLDRVIAQLQKQKDAVQHWQIDEAGLDDLLDELAKKPGFHAVHLTKGPKSEPAPPKVGLG